MKAIDLFSGPGGLTIGMKRAGFEPLISVEWVKDASDTNRSHSPEIDHLNTDIRDVNFKKYNGTVDFIYGGPPCQPFSLGGLRKGKKDSRDMIPEFIRALKEVNPDYFLIENVPGLIMKKASPYFNKILSELSSLGYFVSWKILNSADYGIPQKRRRIFILGCKNEYLNFPAPTHGEGLFPYIKSQDILSKPFGEHPSSPVKFAQNPDLRKSPYAGHIYNGGGRPIDPNGPCHTILASSGGYKTHWVDTLGIAPKYHKHLMEGGKPWAGEVEGARRLSVEECALIQTFPKEIKFIGSRNSQYTQVGDAVPPILAEFLGKQISMQIQMSSDLGIKGNHFVPDQQLKFNYV